MFNIREELVELFLGLGGLSDDAVVILDWGQMCVLEFSKVHQAFNASDSIPNDSEIFCTHWMPRPQPPKGE